MKSFIAGLMFLSFPLASSSAQDTGSTRPVPGARIRVTVPTGAPAREGVLLEWQADGALVLPKGSRDTILIPSDQLVHLEVFAGTRSNALAGAAIGAIVGFASGVATGLLLSGVDFYDMSPGDAFALGGRYAAIGAGVGALWGLVEGKPIWAPIQAGAVQVRAGLTPRRVGLSFAVSF